MPDRADIDPVDLWEEVSRELEALAIADDRLTDSVDHSMDHDAAPAPSDRTSPRIPKKLLDAVRDEVVIPLIQVGRVTAAQLSEALGMTDEDTPLWRCLLQQEGADRTAILESAARAFDHPRVAVVDEQACLNLYGSLQDSHSAYWVELLAAIGAVPVESEIDGSRLRVTFATADPLHPQLARAIERLGVAADVKYAPVPFVDAVRRRLIGELPEENPEIAMADLEEAIASGPDVPSAAESVPVTPAPEEPGQDRPGEADPSGELDEAASADEAVQESSPLTGSQEDEREEGVPSSDIDPRARRDRVVLNLLRKGHVTAGQVRRALDRLDRAGGKEALWRILADVDGVDRETVYTESASVYAFRHEEVGKGRPDTEFALLILETMSRDERDEVLSLNLLPFEYEVVPDSAGPTLVFVTHDPARAEAHRLLGQLNMGRFELRYAREADVSRVIAQLKPRRNEYLDRMSEGTHAYDLGTAFESSATLVDEDELEAEISRSKLINLFEASLVEAVRVGASDIHIFPNARRQVEIHFRIDGRLRLWRREEKVPPESYLAVVKDNVLNVDRFERDQAQDGYIQRHVDSTLIRFRVSVLPIASADTEIRAESVVIRVLDDRKVITDLSQLGMLEGAQERLERAIRQPHGMVILTGPTGSGKSTTLVAALHSVLDPELNTLSIEDPVEYIIEGVRQIKLNHKLDLEAAMRAVLRHDPDIVMVGEVRDKATADLAIKLANTGHLTFSTLHTNDAPSAVSRLFKMGVEPFLIAYAINLVVAQRLIRELCQSCKMSDDRRDPVLMKNLGFTDEEILSAPIYRANPGTTCHRCEGRGYKGRRAISETLHFSTPIRHLIAEAGDEIDEEAIRRIARSEGMMSLQESARELVLRGYTSVEEMMRVTATG